MTEEPIPLDPGLAAFASLQSLLLSTQEVDAFLQELARLAAATLDPRASCGITVRRDLQPFTVASSDALAAQVDEVQYGAGDGPCLEAMRTGQEILVPDLELETRWDDYPRHALAHGVRSSLSLPLVVDGAPIGALNLYGRAPDAFAGNRRQQAALFAAQASAALTLLFRHAHQVEVTGQLEHALASRSLIDQALGIVMAQQRCDADAAFALLRQRSQSANRKLRDIATDIVSRYSGSVPSPPPTFSRQHEH